MKTAVVLLSGGLDSTTTLAVAKAQGFAVHALSVDYGQRHRVELERAERVAMAMGVAEHRTVRLDLRAIGGGARAPGIEVTQGGAGGGKRPGMPGPYGPARQTLLVAPARRLSETVGGFEFLHG